VLSLLRTSLTFLRRPAFRGVWLGLCCAVIAWLLSLLATFRGLEEWMLDGLFQYRGKRPTHARIVLVGLDDDSLAALDKPYSYVSPELAQVVRYAHGQGAAAIGIDLFVPDSMKQIPDIETEGAPGDARPMGQAIVDAGNVVLPQWNTVNNQGERIWQKPLLQWRLKELLNPEPTDLAFVNLTEDGDQFVRRQQLLMRAGESKDAEEDVPVPQFALALFARASGQPVAWDAERGELSVGGEPIRLDEEQMLRINFAGPPGTFPVVPFREVLAAAHAGRPTPEMQGAVVLVGVTARSQMDFHPTPYANFYARYLSTAKPSLMLGTEIQAHIVATLTDRAYIYTPLWLHPLPWLLLFGAVLGRAFVRLNLEWGLLVAVLHHFAWKGVALAAFSYTNLRVEMVAMLLLGVLAYGATFALRWRALRRMFGVVKSQAIALALEADPHQLDRLGEEREITVLFADVRSFTDFSETHTAHEVVALLNAYFTATVPVIEGQGGTVATYMGDGIMVLFGAPATLDQAPLRAVRAAVAMVRRVHELKEQWARLGNPAMRIGVGIHTGKVVVGAMGSPGRLDYTAIGDTVNGAARIEAENKKFGSEILISATTYAALPEDEKQALGCAEQPLEASVKGKKQKLHLYPVHVP
jgi:adenylate cyclase